MDLNAIDDLSNISTLHCHSNIDEQYDNNTVISQRITQLTNNDSGNSSSTKMTKNMSTPMWLCDTSQNSIIDITAFELPRAESPLFSSISGSHQYIPDPFTIPSSFDSSSATVFSMLINQSTGLSDINHIRSNASAASAQSDIIPATLATATSAANNRSNYNTSVASPQPVTIPATIAIPISSVLPVTVNKTNQLLNKIRRRIEVEDDEDNNNHVSNKPCIRNLTPVLQPISKSVVSSSSIISVDTVYDELYKHQKQAVDFVITGIQQHRGSIINYCPGAGKTRIGLVISAKMNPSVEHKILIVAPKSATAGTWITEVKKCMMFRDSEIFDYTEKHRNTASAGDQYANKFAKAKVVFTTYVKLSSMYSELFDPTTSQFIGQTLPLHELLQSNRTSITKHRCNLLNHEWKCVIMDECHILRNGFKSKPDMCKAMECLLTRVKPEAVVAMSGTPVQNDMLDFGYIIYLISLCRDFQPLEGSQSDWTSRIFWKHLKQQIVDNNPQANSILQQIKSQVCVTRTEDDLRRERINYVPATVSHTHEMLMSSKQYHMSQSRILATVQSSQIGCAVYNQDNIITGYSEILSTINACRQICDAPWLQDREIQNIQNPDERMEIIKNEVVFAPKLTQLFKDVDHIMNNTSDKIVIFVSWKRLLFDLKLLLDDRYSGQDTLQYYGDMSAEQRNDTEKKFDNLKYQQHRIIVLTLAAGNCSLNLHAASHVFLTSVSYNPAVDMQAQSRVHRHRSNEHRQIIHIYNYMVASRGDNASQYSMDSWIKSIQQYKNDNAIQKVNPTANQERYYWVLSKIQCSALLDKFMDLKTVSQKELADKAVTVGGAMVAACSMDAADDAAYNDDVAFVMSDKQQQALLSD